MRSTYSPEDNKLRIYPDSVRVDSELSAEEYAKFKAAGYKWAAKQECFVCPRWTPTAENWALRLADSGEIEDEDYSPEERSADRAERFEGYRDKRADEAGARADAFAAGPQVFGNQSQARAERQARRHDRHRTNAVSQWGKAEYWHERTRVVIAHALFKSSVKVRRGRLLTLEAEQRKHDKELAEYRDTCAKWRKVLDLEGADSCVLLADGERYYIDRDKTKPAALLAFVLAGNGLECLRKYVHPRTGKEADISDLLRDQNDPITAREAAELWLAKSVDVDAEGSHWRRWSDHYERRIEYEKAMIEAEGGMAAEVEMVVGGFVGRHQIERINRSPATGRVVSVGLRGEHPWKTNADGTPVICLRSVNIERFGADVYRAPTDAELAEFHERTKARKKAEKATKPSAPQLLNPTDEDAQRLQAILNAIGEAKHNAKYAAKWEREYNPWTPTPVLKMTQDEYGRMSKGIYASAETRTLHNGGGIIARRSSNLYTSEGSKYDNELGAAVCKIRCRHSSGWYNPPHVIVITDKPQKSLPLDWEAIEAARATVSAS